MNNSHDIRTEIVTITPAYAKALLEENTSNRRVSDRNVLKVKEALTRGEWKLNGEAIKIAKDGRVLDGQHRLVACVETGTSFQTMIVYGLDDDTQDTMDSGKSRTASDALTLRGFKSTHQLAAITTAIIRYERWGLRAGLQQTQGYPVSAPQVVARVEKEPALEDLARMAVSFRKSGLTARTAGLLYYVFSAIDPADAEDFMHRLTVGDGLDRGNPILTLRNSLIALKSERGQKDQSYIGALAIKAWNKYRGGNDLLSLRFNPGGANPEKFPEPR